MYLIGTSVAARLNLQMVALQEGRVGDMLDWVGLEWGPQGGLRAREGVLWSQLQREFRSRCLLPEQAVRRLDAIGFCWDPQVLHVQLSMAHLQAVQPALSWRNGGIPRWYWVHNL